MVKNEVGIQRDCRVEQLGRRGPAKERPREISLLVPEDIASDLRRLLLTAWLRGYDDYPDEPMPYPPSQPASRTWWKRGWWVAELLDKGETRCVEQKSWHTSKDLRPW